MTDPARIEDVLRQERVYASTTHGVSMYPLLRDGRDTVVIRPPEGRLRKYDVPLYRVGPKYVLHRIVRVLPDGYVIRGDNCLTEEHVRDEQVIGVLTALYRGDRPVDLSGPGRPGESADPHSPQRSSEHWQKRVWCPRSGRPKSRADRPFSGPAAER